jgi:quercetin dioxygenase-like cupin family protein
MRVTPASEVKFNPLNPDLGDKGPQASVLFGEMGKNSAVGFFIKIPAGFTPGPHIHSSDAYVVVVSGTMHNFEPGSNKGKAVGTGGAWFQPANVAHDNYCEPGADCVFLVYAPNGNDFIPVKDGHLNPALAPAMRVMTANELKFMPLNPDAGDKGPMVSVLFGNMQKAGPLGLIAKVPAGFSPGAHTHSSDDYVVGLSGKTHNFEPGPNKGKAIGVGGTWFQPANMPHDNYCEEREGCTFFAYFPDGFDFKPVQ